MPLIGALCALALAPHAIAQNPQTEPERHWFAPVAQLLSPEYRATSLRISALRAKIAALPAPPIGQQSERIGWHSTFSSTVNATKWLQIQLDGSLPFDAVALVPVDVAYGAYPGPGYGFPVRFRVEVSDDPAFSAPRLLAAYDDTDFPNPGDAPVFILTPGASGKFVRVTATRLWQRGDRALLALGEVIILHGNLDLAAMRPVTASDTYENPPAWQSANATDSQSVLGPPILQNAPRSTFHNSGFAISSPGNGWHSQIATSPDSLKWVQVDLGKEMPLDDVRIFPARPKDFPARSGFGFPVRFRVEAANDPAFARPTTLLDQTSADFVNPGENPVVIPAPGIRARYVRVTATRLWERSHDYIFALSELQVYSGGKNAALGAAVASLDFIERGSWAPRFLVDGFNSQRPLIEPSVWLRDLSRRREALLELAAAEARRRRLAASLAHSTLRWSAVGILLLAAAAAFAIHRARRARRREVERLRQRIAGDLHDEIGSNLGSIALLSEMALREPAGAQSDLTEINRVARETAASMRDIVWLIKPGANTPEDLIAKFRETAALMLAGLDWKLECHSLASHLSLECKRHALLIFKEALHNIRRHASAHHVTIRLTEKESLFQMEIADDGSGFAVAGLSPVAGLSEAGNPASTTTVHPTSTPSSGHGLASIRQRAESMGGGLEIESSPGNGARIIVRMKLDALPQTPRA
jgi:signal transduction histidine kinase